MTPTPTTPGDGRDNVNPTPSDVRVNVTATPRDVSGLQDAQTVEKSGGHAAFIVVAVLSSLCLGILALFCCVKRRVKFSFFRFEDDDDFDESELYRVGGHIVAIAHTKDDVTKEMDVASVSTASSDTMEELPPPRGAADPIGVRLISPRERATMLGSFTWATGFSTNKSPSRRHDDGDSQLSLSADPIGFHASDMRQKRRIQRLAAHQSELDTTTESPNVASLSESATFQTIPALGDMVRIFNRPFEYLDTSVDSFLCTTPEESAPLSTEELKRRLETHRARRKRRVDRII